MTTAFIPCGAKMPVVSLVAGALFGGNALVDETQTHFTQYDKLHARRKKGWLMLYLPARTALVLKKNKE